MLINIFLGYFYFWGVLCMTVTTLVAVFKTEKDCVIDTDDAVYPSFFKTFKLLFRIIKLPSIKMLAIILLTVQVNMKNVNLYL